MRTPPRTDKDRLIAQASSADREAARRTIPLGSGIDLGLWTLHVCYARAPGAALRRVLVEEYDGYARALAWRMHRGGEPIEDLRQVAFEALLVSLNRFDPERRRPFLGFASVTIAGALKRHFRDFGWLLRVPRRVHELAAPMRKRTDELRIELGRAPTMEELATRLDVDVEAVIEAQEAAHARSVSSLTPVWDGEEIAGAVPGGIDGGFDSTIDRVDLRRALAELDESDRDLLCRYFFDGCTQNELADERGVSQMQISRLLTSATRRLASRTAVTA